VHVLVWIIKYGFVFYCLQHTDLVRTHGHDIRTVVMLFSCHTYVYLAGGRARPKHKIIAHLMNLLIRLPLIMCTVNEENK